MFVRRLHDCEEFVAGDRSILREILHPDKGLPHAKHRVGAPKANLAIRYSLAHARVEPGRTTTPHRLRTAEVYYILQGRGRMHIDEQVADLAAGDTVYIPPHATQHIENIGDSGLVFLCIVDPAWRSADEEILNAE